MHDREKFEIYGISFLNQINDGMQNKFSKLFDKFINVEKMSNNEIVKLSRDLDIDIAIDLMCHTKLNRFSIFEKRCAPLQINFLGYPGTSGSDNIDYIIADKIIIPENESKNFTEKIIYLPPSFMVTDDSREISKKIFKKKDFDLPEKSFIFSNFNRIDKITPYIFDVWMDILHEVKNSSLWLISNNKLGIYNLKEEASKRGIDHKRLIFSDKVNSLADHIERIKLSDLCIDTFPYSSHTTGSDILWSGTPIVTLTGKTFASNVCGSMLKSLNLDELITSSLDEYKKKILELAKNPKKLLSIKKMIEERKETENLFNSKKYTNNFEIALSKIYKNCIEQKKLKNVILS